MHLTRIRLLAFLLALCLTAGCKAQTATAPADLNRRIEVLVRARFGLTPDIDVAIGDRKPSNITGYDTLPITFSRSGRTQSADFLISTDGSTLARLDKMDLLKDPIFSIQTAGRPVRGNPDAKVTVISFDDFECPYCGRMHQELFPSTLNRYKDKVRFVYKDFPLLEIHPWAMHAAIDANCLHSQSNTAYWSYADYLHTHGDEINGQDQDLKKSYEALDRIARQEAASAKLNTDQLSACLTAQDETQVRASLKEGIALGIEGAPALFINGEKLNGALPAEYVWKSIDRALRAAGIEPPAEPAVAPAQPKVAQ